MKKEKIVVVKSNIDYKFASENLKYKQKKNIYIYIYFYFFNKTLKKQ